MGYSSELKLSCFAFGMHEFTNIKKNVASLAALVPERWLCYKGLDCN